IIPSLLIAVLSWVIPYGVAFKLVAVSGCVTFPVACWFFGRSARLPFPLPALLSVGGLLFLFDRSFSIYGGNIASTMAGEFAFSTVPFYLRSGYMNDMGWERITSDRYVNYLWSREKLDPQLVNSPDLRWVIAFAAVGLLLSIAFRRRTGLFLALMAATFAVA